MATILVLCLVLAAALVGNAKANQQMEVSEKLINGLQESFITLEDPLSEAHTREQNELLRELHFVPPFIDFGTWSVGQARTRTVMLFNQHTNRTVQLNAVSGPSPVFYSSFFGSREVPPQGNTTFSVVFLPRQLGAISTDLLIQTSFGRAELKVRGQGSECPYRLRPLVGIKAPINATLTPEIHMYNPHERPLQILEVYSSGGEFQLELPSGGSEGPQKLWEIPPHTLKPVIRISFHGRTAGNHSAYIRIKIAEQSDEAALNHANENVLVIPVEFEILPKHAVYARNPLADFGRVATQQLDVLQFKLDMQNQNPNSSKSALIGNYLRDIPGLTFDADNASIVLDPKLFEESATINDLLVIHSSIDSTEKDAFTVLVRAEIFKGALVFERNVSTFISDAQDQPPMQLKRTLEVRNEFTFPLTVYNASLTEPIDATLLDISTLTQRLVLQPSESIALLQFHLLDKQAVFKSMLHIETNVTTFKVPVIACSGRLHVSMQQFELRLEKQPPYSLELDLGTVPFAEMSRDGYVVLRNDNPIPIPITNWYFEPPKHVYFQAHFVGCLPADYNISEHSQLQPNITQKFDLCRKLNEGELAVFILSIQTYVAEQSAGALKVWTPYEVIKTNVRFKASVGQLDIEQEQLNFKHCFPGKICTAVLSIRSSFIHPVHVTAVKFTRLGLRFKDFNAKGSTIAAQTLTKVGRIYFEPAALCGNTCYIKPMEESGLFPSNPGGNNNLLYDGVELRQRTEHYRQFKRQLRSMSLTLHSKELPPLELDFSISIEWPKLVQATPADSESPAIEVGQTQQQSIVLSNPTPHDLLVDYFLADPEYARRTQLSLPHEVIDVSATSCYLTDRQVFKLTNGTPSTPLLLSPGASHVIPLEFSAAQAEKYCTILHVRSNLTLYEAVWLTARAVQSQFRFGNRRPGSTTPLLFELTTEHFHNCNGVAEPLELDVNQNVDKYSVVATRSFTARNAGAVPIRIEGFIIGNQPCEDFGFKVIDCEGFELRENETRKVEIMFTTDFTTSRVTRSLTLVTNLTYNIEYLLLAQLPGDSLERCAADLPRPPWEKSLRHIALAVLLVSFCLVLVAAVLDYRDIIAQQSVYEAARYRGPVQPTFNLRNIAKLQAEVSAAAAKLDVSNSQQQHKLKNGTNAKELRKRVVPTANSLTASTTAEKAARKTKSWTSSWQMDMNILSKHLQKPKVPPANVDVNVKPTITPPKPTSSPTEPKIIKRSTPSPQQQPPPAQPRSQKKAKQLSGTLTMPKQRLEQAATTQEPFETKQTNVKASQENISPKSTKAAAESPKERVLKEQNGASKKLGKTPGRERRKEQRNSHLNGTAAVTGNGPNGTTTGRKNERKPRNKQLNFYANGNANTATVSPPASPDTIKCISSPWETSSCVSFSDVLQTKQFPPIENNENGLLWNPEANELARTEQLGPIGSRKNCPSPWQLWEPTPSANCPNEMPTDQQQHMLFETPTPREPLKFGSMDLPTGLHDEQWERTKLMMKQQVILHQTGQQEYKHRQQYEQQHLDPELQLMASEEPNYWANVTWSANYNAPWSNRQTTSHSTGGVLRPPPGLESTYNSFTPPETLSLATAFVAASTNAQTEQRVPTQYDPFTSPSSIWSDNWRQHQSQSSQQQRNNHMN